ncbi:MAG: protein translocase subunit SecF [Deltaproteobacteria bacterium]|nr:protein translocase subunit SecF [Deltaproteobacteria bacterium]
MEFIKPGTNFDFVGTKKIFISISIAAVLLSLISIFTIGFNMGIDFNGGTKIIVSFKKDSDVSREEIKSVLDEMISKETGLTGAQIEVQDFDVGSGAESEEIKFQIFTELPSLLTEEKKGEILAKLKSRLSDATVDSSFEGGEKFFVALKAEENFKEFSSKIKDMFAEFGFKNVLISSDKEERLTVEYYKERDILRQESKDKNDTEKIEKAEEDYNNKLNALTDSRFTVQVEEVKSRVADVLKEKFKDHFNEVLLQTSISAAVGKELFETGLLAMLYAIIGILIYIALRFDVKFSPGGVIALIHDSIITLGVISVLQIKFALPMIAALLTIIGFSINDTIVVYDRIRENMAKGKFENLAKVINASINETLSRTIMTTGVTLLAVLAIYLLGGGLIKDFAFTLMIGFVVGTYSSIYIASPITLYLEDLLKRKPLKAKAA